MGAVKSRLNFWLSIFVQIKAIIMATSNLMTGRYNLYFIFYTLPHDSLNDIA